MTRQQKYQARHKAAGLCYLCPLPVVSGGKCLKHMVKQRERQRRRVGSKKRYGSLTYRLVREAKQ